VDMIERPAGYSASAPPGWYPDPTTGRPRYWDGTTWGPDESPTLGATITDPSAVLVAAQLRRQAWWRLLVAIVVGSAVAIVILMSTSNTVVWWGGYFVAGSLAWGALKRFRAAGELTGTGVGAGPWTAFAAGLGLVALLAVAAAMYWATPLEPSEKPEFRSWWTFGGSVRAGFVLRGA